MSIKTVFELDAWKKGRSLVKAIYRESKLFPKEEMYGLTSQMRRSAISITSNLAEGFSRVAIKEKLQFYSIAFASSSELLNQLITCIDVEILENERGEEIIELLRETQKLTQGLIKSTKARL
ncbi:MAG: four helix bundle protein [Candidatus Komeilibacteria bacterium]